MARLCARASRGTNRAMYASQLKRMLEGRCARREENMEYCYLITQKQDYVIKSYLNLHNNNVNGFQDYYSQFRSIFDISLVNQYRGISRMPLSPVPRKQKNQYKNIVEPEAQFLMDKYINKYCTKYKDDDIDMLLESSHLNNVINKIISKNRYDPIKISTVNDKKNKKFIGFDIGYWGGDNFSIISDSMLLPMWHGAPKEAWTGLLKFSKKLNNYTLFDNFDDAFEFRSYYLMQNWAEKEMHENEICIQIIEEI